ncbi:MAG: hypothetical protein ACRCVJ_00810 [Clostridium sp.]
MSDIKGLRGILSITINGKKILLEDTNSKVSENTLIKSNGGNYGIQYNI